MNCWVKCRVRCAERRLCSAGVAWVPPCVSWLVFASSSCHCKGRAFWSRWRKNLGSNYRTRPTTASTHARRDWASQLHLERSASLLCSYSALDLFFACSPRYWSIRTMSNPPWDGLIELQQVIPKFHPDLWQCAWETQNSIRHVIIYYVS